jgi:large subunit ribosomal protein L25
MSVMKTITLQATRRNPQEMKADAIRKQGLIPAEYYKHGDKNESLSLGYQEFHRIYREAGESTLVELVIDGKDKKTVLIHEVGYHPVTDKYHHIDFMGVNMKEKIHTHVKINYIGASRAVKDLGGVLLTNIDEIEMKCLPGDLLHHIDVDLSVLNEIHDSIHLADLEIAKNAKYEILTDLEAPLISVAAPTVETDLDSAPTASPADVPTQKELEAKAKEAA